MPNLTFEEIEKLIAIETYAINCLLNGKCGHCGSLNNKKLYAFKNEWGMPIRCVKCKKKVTRGSKLLTIKELFTIKCLV